MTKEKPPQLSKAHVLGAGISLRPRSQCARDARWFFFNIISQAPIVCHQRKLILGQLASSAFPEDMLSARAWAGRLVLAPAFLRLSLSDAFLPSLGHRALPVTAVVSRSYLILTLLPACSLWAWEALRSSHQPLGRSQVKLGLAC